MDLNSSIHNDVVDGAEKRDSGADRRHRPRHWSNLEAGKIVGLFLLIVTMT